MTAEETLVKWLAKTDLTLAVAESCTGGMICSRLVAQPGVSAYFQEGFITYSNRAKMQTLGVEPAVLAQYGAVSAPCALQMAQKAAEKAGAALGLATTGIAGPGGNTPSKPVGLVYIGIFAKDNASCLELYLQGDRASIREQAATQAMEAMTQALLQLSANSL